MIDNVRGLNKMKFCVSDGGILENQKPFQLEM
jgi:hypothetical protein